MPSRRSTATARSRCAANGCAGRRQVTLSVEDSGPGMTQRPTRARRQALPHHQAARPGRRPGAGAAGDRALRRPPRNRQRARAAAPPCGCTLNARLNGSKAPMSHAVLVIEDEAVLAKNILHLPANATATRCTWRTAPKRAWPCSTSVRPDAVVLDFNLPGMNGLEALARIRAFDAGIRVLMVTGHGNVEMAVDAMKAGAFDFLTKPVALSASCACCWTRRSARRGATARCATTRSATHRTRRARRPARRIAADARAEADDRAAGAGRSAACATATRPAVLVLGETGTGKEVVARALALQRPAPRQAVRRTELRRAAGATARVGTLRPRARRLHRRARTQARPGRNRRGRHAVPRRDRRHGHRPAGQAAQAARRKDRAPHRQPARAAGRRAHRRRHAPAAGGAGARRALPRRPVLPARRGAAAPAAAARARRRHPAAGPALPAAPRGALRQAGAGACAEARRGAAARLPLAGQRARAAQHDRTGGAAEQRQT